MVKYVRVGLAAILLTLLLAAGGLTFAGQTGLGGALAQLLAPASLAGRSTEAQPAVALSPTRESPTGTLQAPSQQSPQQVEGAIDARSAVKLTGPAVVTVINRLDVTGGGRPSNPGSPTARGSGVIIDARGYIVTNNHVVENQQSLEVIFSDGDIAPAKLVGTDPFSDLAVIKVDVSVPAVAEFADSDKLEPGQPVVAIGSALGDFANTVTVGVISGLNRDLDDSGQTALQDLIQTDAAINHGNSGGPLIDLTGRIVGINVAVVRGSGFGGDDAEGLGFAIPSNTARAVSEQLIQNGRVDRPYLGISYQLITPQVAAYYNLPRDSGILVGNVQAGSPAAQAGITANSIITKFDGVALNQQTSLLEQLMKHKVGDTVTLVVLPEGSSTEREVTVKLGTRPPGQ